MSGSRSKKIRAVFRESLKEQYVICFNAMCGQKLRQRLSLGFRIIAGRKIGVKK
jgi:hypothetical protein